MVTTTSGEASRQRSYEIAHTPMTGAAVQIVGVVIERAHEAAVEKGATFFFTLPEPAASA